MQLCHIIWESYSDLEFRVRNGHRKTKWIGCNKKGCKLWAHANCGGLFLIPGKSMKITCIIVRSINLVNNIRYVNIFTLFSYEKLN